MLYNINMKTEQTVLPAAGRVEFGHTGATSSPTLLNTIIFGLLTNAAAAARKAGWSLHRVQEIIEVKFNEN